MNILTLNYEFPPIGGGASPVSYDICKHLVSNGNKVTVVTMEYENLPKHEIRDGIDIYRVECIRKHKAVCHPWEQLSYIISAISFISNKKCISDFDIVHTHFIVPTGVVSLYLKRKYGIPYIITAHGSDVIGHNDKRFGLMYRLIKRPWSYILREAKAVVSPSEYLENLMKRSEKKANYICIPNGIDSNIFKPLQKKKSILVMCRLQETKRVDVIIKAFAGAYKDGWRLDIAGDGPELEKLQIIADELNILDKVNFYGWIQNKSAEHLKMLGEASVFVSASVVENCPVSVLEALCSGCKVIVSDIPAHKELLMDNGIYFHENDVEELQQLLTQCMCGQIQNECISNDIREKADWKYKIKQYEEVL